MATITLKCTTTSTDLTSDNLSSVVEKTATVTEGGITRDNITVISSDTPKTIISHANHTAGAYVYLKNAGALNLFIKLDAESATNQYEMYLTPGDWALFPWAADTSDIRVYANANTGCLIEYGVFE
tara:strand:+ start:502 stop:879 length:378 start_codon:yes stop_codon:yes gene_type:complete